jgi:stage II sporulation protein R
MFVRKWLTGIVLVLAGAAMVGSSLSPAAAGEGGDAARAAQLIRLHVVAHSDSPLDQAVKHLVRDTILAALDPLLQEAATPGEALEAIRSRLAELEETAAAAVRTFGPDHGVRADLGRFPFPTRRYGSLLLPSGEYAALRVVIGAGEGRNWWCVLFPPLCFADWTTGVVLEPRSDRENGRALLGEMEVRARFALPRKVSGWLSRK